MGDFREPGSHWWLQRVFWGNIKSEAVPVRVISEGPDSLLGQLHDFPFLAANEAFELSGWVVDCSDCRELMVEQALFLQQQRDIQI